jgi:hypothetical protein
MFKVDTSDWNKLVDKYQARGRNLESRPFGQYSMEVQGAIKHALLETLQAGEMNPLEMHQKQWLATNTGPYHDNGTEEKRINPQEFISTSQSSMQAVIEKYASYGTPIHAPGGIHGSGRLYGDSYVDPQVSGAGIAFSLETNAEMQPYPNLRTGYNQQKRPIMYYMRHGWTDPDKPEHSMKKRPFGRWLAERSIGLLGSFQTKLLRAAGFKGG